MGRACPALTGNPLALKLASTSIGELFGGDIAAYLADLDFGPGALFGEVRNLLDGQVQRLSALEHDVLRWFAIEREPISFSESARASPPASVAETSASVDALCVGRC